MKNQNRNNAGFTIIELLMVVALLVVICFVGARFMADVTSKADGFETVNVERVMEAEDGVYVMDTEGAIFHVTSPAVAETLTKGENRVKVEKDAATGRNVIIASELSEKTTVAATHRLVPEGEKKDD